MKKLVVKTENCIGCGACVGIDSEHFTFNDDGFSIPVSNENLDSDKLQTAIDSCPVGIISVLEDDCNCEENCECKENCEKNA